VITSCWHIYCQSCLTDLQTYAARRGHDGATCSECGELYASQSPIDGLDGFGNEGSVSESLADAAPGKDKAKAKGKKRSKGGDMEDWIGMNGGISPSVFACFDTRLRKGWLT